MDSRKAPLLKTAAGTVDFDGDIEIDGKASIKKICSPIANWQNFAEAHLPGISDKQN